MDNRRISTHTDFDDMRYYEFARQSKLPWDYFRTEMALAERVLWILAACVFVVLVASFTMLCVTR